MTEPQILGTLHTDLRRLARRVYEKTALVDAITVWADDIGDVHGSAPSEIPYVPVSWIAGTFNMAARPEEIEEDLRMILRERARCWLAD